MIDRIPRELQELRQWVAAGEDKVPINPNTGRNADPGNRLTWGSFAEANGTGLRHIGFTLAPEDPYTIIDLDDPFLRADKTRITPNCPDHEEALTRVKRHARVMQLFDSYTEISQSGQGMHIIVRGRVPKGVRRDKVEVYSSHRYMICTGNVFHDAPIADRQELLDVLFAEMDTTATTDLVEGSSVMDDKQVVDMAMRASNADKFNRLCAGQWEGHYSSQSEADLALLTILAYYTRDNEQVRRLFRYSKLGQRDKAMRDDYLNGALRKIRAKQPPLVDLSNLTLQAAPEPVVVQETPASEPQPKQVRAGAAITFPPGLVGDIARFVMGYAVRPVPEIALATGIALTAGIVGRSYNISNTGLNQYVIVLAPTGSGKEAVAQATDCLINAVRMSGVPMADQFVGPAAFGSGQGLVRTLADGAPCFVSVLGEFGLTLQQISSPRANAAEQMLLKVLLDLYGKSGWGQTLRSTAYSDKEKNTKIVQAPALTIIGESTPESFYDGLSEALVSSGLIPRFLTIQYDGPRPQRNDNPFNPPDGMLVKQLADLCAIALATQQNATCAPVQLDSEAKKAFARFDKYVDSQFSGAREAITQIWNRAHLKALKLAGLVAVGINPHAPIVTLDAAKWAIDFVITDAMSIVSKFTQGDIGNSYSKQFATVLRWMEGYRTLNTKQRQNYKAPATVIHKDEIVPLAMFTTMARTNKAFNATPNRTPRQLVEQTLKDLVDEDVIQVIPLDQCLLEFKTKMPLYVRGINWNTHFANLQPE